MSDIRIRPARDRAVLARLAALDSASPLAGDALVAEKCGQPVAAIEIDTGRTIADPFRRTADVVELLHLRVRTGRPHRSRRALGRGFHPRAA